MILFRTNGLDYCITSVMSISGWKVNVIMKKTNMMKSYHGLIVGIKTIKNCKRSSCIPSYLQVSSTIPVSGIEKNVDNQLL
jgi:hypothetical protein